MLFDLRKRFIFVEKCEFKQIMKSNQATLRKRFRKKWKRTSNQEIASLDISDL